MNHKTQDYIKKLDSDFETADHQEDEIKNMLAKLLCVRAAALMEVYFKARISDYTNKKVPNAIQRFVNCHFKDITNLKSSKMKSTLEMFNTEWAEKFILYLEDNEEIKDSLDSLVQNRHNIAHGQDVGGITLKRIWKYYIDVKEIVNELDRIIV